MPFAEQLVVLDENQYEKAMPKAKKGGDDVIEIRNVADPMYVSKWLVAFLTNEDSTVVTGTDFPKIIKKIRDDVIFKGGDLPFRRSGLWMVMKVALRLNLETEFKGDAANFIYKIIQIRLASRMCEFLLRREYQTIDAELAMQMLAKVARKLDKLSTFSKTSVKELKCQSLYSLVTTASKQTILKVREKINDQFIKLDLFDRREALLKPLDDIDFQRDTIHKIPSLSTYITTRMQSRNASSVKSLLEPQPIPRHRIDVLHFPNFEFAAGTTEVNMTLLLADVENWIRENSNKCTAENVLSLRDLAIKYGTAAKKHYKNDPLGGSRMILAILQIIRMLDKIAIEEYSLLDQHHSGINPRIIEDLLLPSRDQLKTASNLERYFEQRNFDAPFPALNAEEKVTPESFSYRYAESNLEMRDLRQTILDAEERRIEEKMEEVNLARLQIQQWKEEAKNLDHEFIKIWSTYQFRTVHSRKCKLCALTKKWTKCVIPIYERSIKNEEHYQYAIVFELLIPTEISCLRDVLQFAAEEFFFTVRTNNKLNVRGNWIDYEQISFHKEEWDRRVHLGR